MPASHAREEQARQLPTRHSQLARPEGHRCWVRGNCTAGTAGRCPHQLPQCELVGAPPRRTLPTPGGPSSSREADTMSPSPPWPPAAAARLKSSAQGCPTDSWARTSSNRRATPAMAWVVEWQNGKGLLGTKTWNRQSQPGHHEGRPAMKGSLPSLAWAVAADAVGEPQHSALAPPDGADALQGARYACAGGRPGAGAAVSSAACSA